MSSDDTITLSGTPTHDAADAGANTVIPRRLGHVSLIRELGRGGMGSVWLGRDEMLGREVAVKFLLNAVTDADDPGFARFLEGARAAATLRHPSLTAIHAAELINGVPYQVMEFVDGPTVAAVLERHGPLAPGVAHAIVDAVADAISTLHERGIVHRDIKPSNVLLDADGGVFVTDFGLTCRRAAEESKTQVAGTPAYMAPEVFEGQVSPKSDVYALGVMLYEMLTGERPFRGAAGSGTKRVEREAMPREPLAARGLPEALTDVIERAVHVNPLFRHKSAATFRQAVDDAMGSRPDAVRDARAIAALVTRAEGQTEAVQATAAPQSTSSSYFDSLAQIAARKRGDTSDKSNVLAIQPTSSIDRQVAGDPLSRKAIDALALHPTGELPKDRCVPCIQCGYDLRGQAIQGRCPECGAANLDSALPDRLVFRSMAWLHKVVLGLVLLRYSYALVIGSFLFVLASVALVGGKTSDAFLAMVDRIMIWGSRILIVIAMLGPAVGVWFATAPDPDRGRSSQEMWHLWLARISIVIAGPLVWLIGLASLPGPLPVRITFSVLLGALLLAGMIGFGFVISRNIARIPDAILARRMKLDSIQVGLLLAAAPSMLLLRRFMGVVAPIIMFVLLIALFWYWWRIGKCEKALRQVLRLSRRD